MKKMSRAASRRIAMGAALTAIGILSGTSAFAANQAGQTVAAGKLFGNIPNVTVRGVQAGGAPWVVQGNYKLTKTDLSASGKWLIIPEHGYLANGTPIPASIAGTTAGVQQVAAEITFANAKPILTKPVKLDPKGDFKIDVMLSIPKGAVDPVILIGPVGKGSLSSWFASSDFLMDYGQYSSTTSGSGASTGSGGGSGSGGGGSTGGGTGW